MEFRHWNEDTEEGYEDWQDIDNNLDIQIGFTGSEKNVKVSIGDDADEFGLGIFAIFSKQSPEDTILNALIEMSGKDVAVDLLCASGQTKEEAKKHIKRSRQHDQRIMFRIKHNVCRLLVTGILGYYGLANEEILAEMDTIEKDYKNNA